MKNAYVIVPVVCVLLFAALYWSYFVRREAALAALQAQAADTQRADAARAHAALVASRHAAAAATAARQQARAEREQREAEEKAAQLAAEQRRTHAFEHERKLRSQLDRRRAEITRTSASLAMLARRQQELADESAFLTAYLDRAEPNRETYYRLLEKIDATEKALASLPPATRALVPAGR